MKPQINVIIFDFDGVIVNSGADIVSAVRYTQKYFNQPELSSVEIMKHVGWGVERLISGCFAGCENNIIKTAIPIYKNYYLENCIVDTKLYENVKEILHFFKGKKIALVTNKPEDLTIRILEGLNVRDYFKLIVGPESGVKLKPDPEGINRVLTYFEENSDKAIMIGDTYTDVEAGKNAGTYTCGVTYGLGSTQELITSAPDFIIDNIIKLSELIV